MCEIKKKRLPIRVVSFLFIKYKTLDFGIIVPLIFHIRFRSSYSVHIFIELLEVITLFAYYWFRHLSSRSPVDWYGVPEFIL
jgi:hypothetical protein